MLVVVAKIKAVEGHADKLADLFKGMVEWVTENEVDTVTYTCNRSTDDPNLFVFFERYTTRQAHEEHSRSDKFLELVSALQGSVDGPVEIETYEELAAKL